MMNVQVTCVKKTRIHLSNDTLIMGQEELVVDFAEKLS